MKETILKKITLKKHNQLFEINWPPIKDIDYVTKHLRSSSFIQNKKLLHLYIHTHTYQKFDTQ